MFKKITAVLLAVCLILGLCACSAKIKTDKKIAILVAPQSEYPEDYMAAMELQSDYPDSIVVKEYADSRVLQAGDGPIITASEELAKDDSIGAIIYARATQFTRDAIVKAKAVNSSLITVAIEPEEELKSVAQVADFVICCDWAAAAKDIIAAAKAQGAEYFVYFSTARIANGSFWKAQAEAFKSECEAANIKFVQDNGYDPADGTDGTSENTGVSKAQSVIKERLAYLRLNKLIEGENVALFSTDVSVQDTLVELADANSMIYVSPEFPSVFSGIGTAHEVTLPEKSTDIKSYVKSLESAIKDDECKAKLSHYDFNLMKTFIKAAFVSVADMMNGTADAETIAPDVVTNLTTKADNENFAAAVYGDYSNVVCGYCSAYTQF